jgi:predicted nucleic acid-binding protein
LIVADTSFAYALLDDTDVGFVAARDWYEARYPDMITTPLVLCEVDHLAARRLGTQARSAFRADVAAGGYTIAWWGSATEDCVQVAERYVDLGVGFTDASLVALAARLETTSIATFDERHFRAMKPLTGEPAFTLLPVDA